MLFNSLHFALFFVIVLSLVAWLRNDVRKRNVVLLVASYYFYGCWDYRFLSLIALSTVTDYLCGRWLNVTQVTGERPVRTRADKLVLATSLTVNLGILAFFKYFNFFADSTVALFDALGMQISAPVLRIILPVGISFYTFQTLSYTIDVFRGRVTSEHNLLNYATYLALFPQLVAGPIERGTHLLPQIRTTQTINWEKLWTGFHLIGWGLFKKVVIADNIAGVADALYNGDHATGLHVVIGTYAFAVQIYCDFSAYSDIARGVARCMGFDLMLNFNLPYFATNPSDFWRRWHISLSTWLRDYLYIGLGGNRHGTYRTYFNLMATMVLGGLWHGAAWTFVFWGVYHGGLLCVHRMLQPWLERCINPRRAWTKTLWFWLRVAFFFQITCYGWLLFRARSFDQVFEFTASLFGSWSLQPTPGGIRTLLPFIPCTLLFFGVQAVQWFGKDLDIFLKAPTAVRALVYAAGILGFIWFGNFNGHAFIYFQF